MPNSFPENGYRTPILPLVTFDGAGRQLAAPTKWGQYFAPGNYFDPQWYFDIPWRNLTYNTPPVLPGIGVDDTIPESMLGAAIFSFQDWLAWIGSFGAGRDDPSTGRTAYAHPIYQYMTVTLNFRTYVDLSDFYYVNFKNPSANSERTQRKVAAHMARLHQEAASFNSSAMADLRLLHSFLATAGSSLGNKWTVSVPMVCYKNVQQASDLFGTEPEDPSSNDTPIYEWSDLPSVDGGWVDTIASSSDNSEYCDGVSTILGMGHREDTDMFTSDNGLMGALLRFDPLWDDFNIGGTPSSEYFYKQVSLDLGLPSLYLRASIAPQWVFTVNPQRGSNDLMVSAVLSTKGYVYKKQPDTTIVSSPTIGVWGGWNARSMLDLNPGADIITLNTYIQDTSRNIFRSPWLLGAAIPFANPRQAIIPILSKTRNYGPWHFSATFANSNLNVVGKTKVIQDDSLNPWEYGGCKYLSLGAQYLAHSVISDVDRGERGSITIAGYPENQLGAEITKQPINLSDRVIQRRDYGGFEYNYVNVGGLSTQTSQITNLSVAVGPGGITSQYQLSSFTPVFEAFNKLDQDRFKRLGQQAFQNAKQIRQNIVGNFRSLRSAIREWMRTQGMNDWAAHDDFGGGVRQDFRIPQSPHEFIIGGYLKPSNDSLETDFTKKQVGSFPTTEITNFNSYDVSSIMSQDGFYRPIKTKKGDVNHPDNESIPQDNQPGTAPAGQPKQSVDPYGPLNAGAKTYVGPIINKDYLDFLANPTDTLVTQRDPYASDWANQQSQNPNPLGYPSGHDIEVVGRSNISDMEEFNFGALGVTDPANTIQYTDDYRYMAHRGPLVVHGWGYDIMGKPIPNHKENNISGGGSESAGNLLNGGVFGTHQTNYSGLSDQFYGGWLQRPDTWPAGPVDLRWDRNRGVWTVPSDLRFYLVRLTTNLAAVNDTATCNVYNAEDVFDTGGDIIPTPQVTVTMPYADVTISADQDILVYWSHESGMYFPIQACCDGGGGTPPPPPPPPPPPCDQCDSRCEYECTAGGWVVRNDNCQSQPGCSCPGSVSCLPQDLCQPANYGLFTSCACINADCPQYLTFDSAINPATEAGIDFYSDRQVPGIQGTVTVELIQDMPSTTGYTFGSGLTKIYDDQPYAGIISGTGVDYSAIICTPGQTGQDPYCAFDTTNPYIVVVSNANNFYNLPSGTTATIKFKYGTNAWEILEYKLPNQGCLEVSSDTTLNYYLKVFADASAGDVVLTLPLATGEGVAGREYQIKKIDTSANSVIISGTGNDTIDGGDTYYLNNQYEAAKFVACGNDQWFVF
jgi:hypothetical protein